MRFRDEIDGDLDLIRSRSGKEYDKLQPPEDAEEAITGTDEGSPKMVMRAGRVAEVYLAIDHSWATPAMRWAMIVAAYREMQKRLKQKGYMMAYCFFADGVPNGYVRRLVNELGAERVVERCIRFTAEGGK